MLSSQQVKAFYDRLGKGQDSQSFYEDVATDMLIQHAGFENAAAVFELGCGTGRFAAKLLGGLLPVSAMYLGVDLSSTMIGLARQRIARFGSRAQVQLGSGSTLPDYRAASFDRFVSNYVFDLLSVEDAQKLIKQAAHMLMKGGLLGLVSLTHGSTLLSRFVTGVWTAIYSAQPMLVGGCRPIELTNLVSGPDWKIRFNDRISRFGVPSEVLVAERLGTG